MWGINLKFKGNIFAGLAAGSSDNMKSWTNDTIDKAYLDRQMLQECLPPSEHFTEKGYMNAMRHMKNGNHVAAREALSAAALETSSKMCVWMFQKIILEVVVGCPRILAEALPMTYY